MNADGELDVVVGYAEARGSAFFNSGKGSAFVPLDFGDGRGSVYGLALADLDGDGLVDIVAARRRTERRVLRRQAVSRDGTRRP